MTYERVFVIEITGPTLDFVRERLESLPNLRAFVEHGASGRLLGPRQPCVPSSFGTLLTGSSPGRTGFFDYFRFAEGSYDRVPYDLGQLEHETVFERLSAHGKTVGLLNVPFTYPLPDVRGFVVTGDEGVGDEYARPRDVLDELNRAGYAPAFGGSYATGRETDFHRHAIAVLERRLSAARRLFSKREWQFGMLAMHAYSELLHAFWRFYDPRHPAHRPFREVFGGADPLLEGLVVIDGFVGEVVELCGPRGLVVVLGAWGHELEHSRVYLNNWLARRGWLRFRRAPKTVIKRAAFRMGVSSSSIEKLAHRLNLYKLFHYALPRGKRAAVTGATFLSYADVDWARTRAVSMGYLGQIYLNVRGERPQGSIAAGDRETVRGRLRRELEDLRDPRSGDKVVERVWTREEIYAGGRAGLGPDLIPEYRPGYSGDSGFAAGGKPVVASPDHHSSDHSVESFVLALGEGVRRGEIAARLEDVAPTVLRALGVPPAADGDGRVLPIFD